MMTPENTEGYGVITLAFLNEEFERRFLAGEWFEDEFEIPELYRDRAEKSFADEVSKR